jgi:ABC-2 type transport system ATP-binding protein
VLRVKLESGELPPALAARATRDAGGAWRMPIADIAHVEAALRELRVAGAAVASLEVAEPELEEVFVKIMRREEKVL